MIKVQSGAAAKAINEPLQVGVAQTVIQIPEGFLPAQGFNGIHDDLYVKTLLLNNGTNKTAIVSIDMTSLGNIDGLKDIVQTTTGVKAENIFIYAAHNFSSPHMFADDGDEKTAMFSLVLDKAIEASARTAFISMQPAKLGYGTGISNVNINRDAPTADGWWHGNDAAGYSDKELGVIKIDDLSGKALAIFMKL